jgi:hypothetical protein
MSSDQIDKLYLSIQTLEKKINKQNKLIQELKEENQIIIENTTKMGNHIDFINSAYDKISKSYLFRNIFT